MPGEFVGLVAILCVFGIPLSAIWTHHRRKILEMQLQLRNTGDVGTRAEIAALREEVRSLKETTMQYDLSFDSALQRLERRVEGVERRVNGVGTSSSIEGSVVEEMRVGR
ncbi:MAG TPA: hypothetical protein VKU00_20050 [Chthonomonadaceae bacterium]|nr:hypothetical protein [Chthonomonadaceae bacterium]